MDEKLHAIVAERLSESVEFTEESAFADLGLTSLSIFEIAIALEEQFELDGDGTIPDDDIYKDKAFMLPTVGDLQRYIERRTGDAGARN